MLLMKKIFVYCLSFISFLALINATSAYVSKNKLRYNSSYLGTYSLYSLYGSLKQCLSYRDKQAEQYLNDDERKKVQLIWQIAKRKDANGLAKLGDLYLDGWYQAQNLPAALACYYQAALHGSGYARFLISVFYTEGIFLSRDLAKSVRWYEKGLNSSYVNRARRMLAQRSLDRNSKLYNVKRGITWYLYAAGQGDQIAQIKLADIYNQGLIVPEDKLKALKWYSRVAFRDYAYKVVTQFIPTDYQYNFEVVDDQCSQLCLNQGGHWNGESVTQVDSQSMCGCFTMQQQTLNDLEKYALYQLAGYYQNGEVVKKDERIALNIMHTLAKSGYAKAAYNLGYMYYNDIGVTNITQSNALAYAWMKMTYPTIKQAGDVNGYLINRMDDVMTQMTPEDRKTALQLYQHLSQTIKLTD